VSAASFVYNPSVGLALRIAETFGVPVEELFEIARGGES
jgi:DNA-binding XRE family transcriptional regulator